MKKIVGALAVAGLAMGIFADASGFGTQTYEWV